MDLVVVERGEGGSKSGWRKVDVMWLPWWRGVRVEGGSEGFDGSLFTHDDR